METHVYQKNRGRLFIVFIFGPPGSGKGTQAERLEKRLGAVHLDTGRLIEKTVHDPRLLGDPLIQRERKLFDSGILCTPEWITEIIQDEIRHLASKRKSVILSGSPRTLFEAERIVPFLEELYGKDRIIIFRIHVSSETSIFRNSHRTICEQCGTPQVYYKEKQSKKCAKCGGTLVRRSLDTIEAIQVRLKEYKKRTRPIYSFLEERGYVVVTINGEPDPETVSKNIQMQMETFFE